MGQEKGNVYFFLLLINRNGGLSIQSERMRRWGAGAAGSVINYLHDGHNIFHLNQGEKVHLKEMTISLLLWDCVAKETGE